MTREKDMTVAICAVVCYLIVVKILSPESVALIRNIAVEKVPLAFKNTANTLVGIIVGLLLIISIFQRLNYHWPYLFLVESVLFRLYRHL